MVPVMVNGQDTGAMVDSGSAVSLIQPQLLGQVEAN